MSAMIVTLPLCASFQERITATSVIAEARNDDGGRRWLRVRPWLTHEARMQQLVSDSQFWLAGVACVAETLLTKAPATPALNTAANKCTRNG